MRYVLVAAGCAECHGPGMGPLIVTSGPFDTPEEAKATVWTNPPQWEPTWEEHPQGGWVSTTGQGEDWVMPVPDDFPEVPRLPD